MKEVLQVGLCLGKFQGLEIAGVGHNIYGQRFGGTVCQESGFFPQTVW